MKANNTVREQLHQTALKAPSSSGVYLWRNPQGTVIYVGKAKSLKSRLSSYFSGEKDVKTQLLISHAQSIEYITTANEYEAFLLENNLIKKYTPRYNINLKDGKSYPVLRITNEPFPRLFKTRRIIQDGSVYFGPFPDAGALDTFIEAIARIYPVRHCRTFKKRDAPCMYYHIGRCKAPCCGKISEEAYTLYIGEIEQLLEGKGDDTIRQITAQMKEAAASLNFEKAARLRDGLKALTVMQNQNAVEGFDSEDRDYLAHWREGELVSFTVMRIRSGKLTARDNFRLVSLNEDGELLPEFLNAYYTGKDDVPPKIYVRENGKEKDNGRKDNVKGLGAKGNEENGKGQRANGNEEKNGKEQGTERNGNSGEIGEILLTPDELERWFRETLGAETEIVPVTGDMENAARHIASLNMAFENAHEDIIRRLRERGDMPALEELKTLLGLPRLPVRIEGFDIAHIGGKFPVASLISFYNGNPDKSNYREFRLKTTDGIIDDFASMREATSRRYTRLVNEQAELPDLILIDGGIGQVNAVAGVITSLGLDIPIAGLAKRDEEIYRPGNSVPICLPKRSDALRLLQRVRDETHRFATSRNQNLRTKENTESIFTELPGVGEQRARILMKTFTTIENLADAEEAQIAQTLHVRANAASEILLAAQQLSTRRQEKKDAALESLGAAGTTAAKAAAEQYTDDLAGAALAAEDEPTYGKQPPDD